MFGESLIPNAAVVLGPRTWQLKPPVCGSATRVSVELPLEPQPLRLTSKPGFAARFPNGSWTVIAVLALPASALVAVNVTAYGAGRPSLDVGVQVSVPDVRLGAAVNTALCPAGSAPSAAVNDAIASPSGSLTVTASDNCWPSV